MWCPDGEKIAEDMSVPFLGSIPIDPEICEDSDKGAPFILEHRDSAAAKAFIEIVNKIENHLEQKTER